MHLRFIDPIIILSPRLALFTLMNSPTTDTFTLSLHDALPISRGLRGRRRPPRRRRAVALLRRAARAHGERARVGELPLPRHRLQDRKSTRLNSSHVKISYAVFCLKKKNSNMNTTVRTARYSLY